MDDIFLKNKWMNQKNDWLWNRIFGSNTHDITKHERNLEILAMFVEFVNIMLENLNGLTIKLRKFKDDVDNLKQIEFLLEEEKASYISPKRHVQLLNEALGKLRTASDTFQAKIHRENPSDDTL
ncbi:unnamed protein product [Adineta ricciae]|uniref:Uncharacterized protein n=1 Tax=Adineta ricciae TaxID=249248 RepID=A0A815I282_ADIRI|nr:unnamed protein product [Adineta ricciae]CAF1494551.1 unnamed protein product [Adineta ricciae]